MLNIRIICVGKLREKYFIEAFQEYAKRLGAYCRLDCVEIQEQRLPEDPGQKEIVAALDREAGEILHAVPTDAYLCALCVEGRQIPSDGMAELIAAREGSGKPKLCFVIGGSFGLSPKIKEKADLKLSFSPMTFPHHLARVMLAEQIYRGFKINEGSRYHK